MLRTFGLEGAGVRLEPLTEAHIPALVEAAALDRSTYQWTYTPDGVEQMTDYVRDALVKVASQAHVAFATVNDKIYAFGGFTLPDSGPPTWKPIDNAWEYDPAADSWKALAPMPTLRGAGRNG